jgi:AcrR family transcriptional regulator
MRTLQTGHPADRRSRKKAETREALTRAALRLALDRGYEQLTVEAITDEADVSVRTFFNYFASKDEALLGSDLHGVEMLAAWVAERPPDESPVAALRSAFAQLAESFVERQPIWQARIELLRRSPELWGEMLAGFAAFERSLVEMVAARTGSDPDADLYPGVLAAAAVGAMRVAITHWHAGGDSAPLAELVMDAFDVLAGGLGAPEPSGASR